MCVTEQERGRNSEKEEGRGGRDREKERETHTLQKLSALTGSCIAITVHCPAEDGL